MIQMINVKTYEDFMEHKYISLFNAIDQQIALKHLLKNPFYQAWSKGELSLECLQDYAKDYYHHVKAFPRYLAALLARVENPTSRRVLLQNLIEEEAGTPNHPELWKNFVLALGVTEAELAAHQPSAEMITLVNTFLQICTEETHAEGIAALYSYESQIPEICVSKIDGLQKFYGMNNPKSWEYFSVHIAADEQHAAEEKKILALHAHEASEEKICKTVENATQALWDFLSGICHRYNIACA